MALRSGTILFAVTELAEGKTLSILLEETGPIPFERAVAWVKQVADALDYAHAGLAIHRDVKPSNIILSGDEKVRFWISAWRVSWRCSQYKAASRVGTVAYMAPGNLRA